MEITQENDRNCYDGVCQSAKRIAFSELSTFIESLAVNNLQPNEREGRIYVEIGKVEGVMKRYFQYPYIMFYDDPILLFERFQSLDPIHHPELLEIFMQSMIQREKYNILYLLFMENRAKEQAENYSAMPQAPQPNQVLELNRFTWNLPWQHFYLPYASGLFTNSMIPSLPQADPSVEEVLTMIITKLNERIGYLKYESDIQPLVRIILNPKAVETGVEIALGCKTNEFKYSIPHFKLFNKDFTYANIGRTCCFFSKGGCLITDTNLGSTTYKNLNTRHAIDNIFAEFRKK